MLSQNALEYLSRAITQWWRHFIFGRHPKMDSPDIIVVDDMGLIKSLGGGAGVKLALSLYGKTWYLWTLINYKDKEQSTFSNYRSDLIFWHILGQIKKTLSLKYWINTSKNVDIGVKKLFFFKFGTIYTSKLVFLYFESNQPLRPILIT